MHHALVFSTSKHSPIDSDAASWLANLADAFAFLYPSDAPYWLHQDHATELLCQADNGFEAKNLPNNNAFKALRRRQAIGRQYRSSRPPPQTNPDCRYGQHDYHQRMS